MNVNGLGADYTLNLTELGEVIAEFAQAQEPLMVWGSPGVGKSAVALQAAQRISYHMHDIRALQLDTVDTRGLPHLVDGVMKWAPPSFLPKTDSTDKHLLFFDELPSAMPDVQASLYQLIQDRKVGDYALPKGAAMIAAGNREDDRGHSHQMLSPLASRFVHVEVAVPDDGREWTTWAVGAGLAPEVIFFIDWKPDLLFAFDPRTWKGRGFPCPREWEKVSNIVGKMSLSPTTMRAAVNGAVGEEAGVEFLAWMDVWQKIPPVDLILNDPHNAPIPADVSALIATCGALYKSKKVDSSNFEAVTAYAGRTDMREEVGEFLINRCSADDPSLMLTMAWKKWEISHQ